MVWYRFYMKFLKMKYNDLLVQPTCFSMGFSVGLNWTDAMWKYVFLNFVKAFDCHPVNVSVNIIKHSTHVVKRVHVHIVVTLIIPFVDTDLNSFSSVKYTLQN